MAHYDCNNCGASMGVGFGSCESCTPLEYMELQFERNEIYNRVYKNIMDAHREYASYMAKLAVEDITNRMRNIEKDYRVN